MIEGAATKHIFGRDRHCYREDKHGLKAEQWVEWSESAINKSLQKLKPNKSFTVEAETDLWASEKNVKWPIPHLCSVDKPTLLLLTVEPSQKWGTATSEGCIFKAVLSFN